jgi:lysophospholipase L1-like esterase
MRWRSFVALGDSFTEGMDDPYEDGRGYRGWADLVAAQLARHRSDTAGRSDSADGSATADGRGFGYANLAVRGRLFPQVVDEQVPAALAMKPDLITFAAGGNDALRRGFQAEVLMRRFDETVRDLRETGADVVLFRWADISGRLPGGRVIGPRVQVMNDAVAATGDRHGALVVDMWGDEAFRNPRMWSVDRLHLSAVGHRRVAAHVLTALGVPAEPDWLAAVPPPERLRWTRARAADARWATNHLAPWIKRRLTGRSSGDLVQPKRPALEPVTHPV